MLHLNISRKSLRRVLILAAAATLIFLFRPHTSTGSFEYAEGKSWNYDALRATIDIEIFNDTATQKSIEDSLKRGARPIYYRDDDIASSVVDDYTAKLNQSHRLASKGSQRSRMASTLRDIYRTGVIDSRGADMPETVNLRISNNEVKSQPSATFYTFASAHAKMQEAIDGDTALHSALAAIDLVIRPNVLYDSTMNAKANQDIESYARAAIGKIHTGDLIVDRGDIITPRIYNILRTYERKMAESGISASTTPALTPIGALLTILIILCMLFGYLAVIRADYFENLRAYLFLISTVTAFTIFAIIMHNSFNLGVYMTPLTIIPIIILVFLDSRTAFFTFTVTVLMVAALTHFMWDFIVMQLATGMVALLSIRELSKRSQLIQAAALVFAAYSVAYIAIQLMLTGETSSLEPRMFGALAINATLLSFAYFIIFIVEKCFGFVSRVTLVELADINNPLLRELSEECPGTFQHSTAVSNLAAGAATRLGANVQIVRAGALYHDIGKISNPAFFTENQYGVNPHDTLDPKQSAKIVIGHVTEGARRADKAKLPTQLRDFILQHHGRGKARYFYTTYCNQHPDEEVDPAPFTYPGPNPQTLEASILMMADAVEAASRSLKDHSPATIDALVNKIIDAQVGEGLHNESPISFRDITEIKKSFAATLRTMYHSRISYPDPK